MPLNLFSWLILCHHLVFVDNITLFGIITSVFVHGLCYSNNPDVDVYVTIFSSGNYSLFSSVNRMKRDHSETQIQTQPHMCDTWRKLYDATSHRFNIFLSNGQSMFGISLNWRTTANFWLINTRRYLTYGPSRQVENENTWHPYNRDIVTWHPYNRDIVRWHPYNRDIVRWHPYNRDIVRNV